MVSPLMKRGVAGVLAVVLNAACAREEMPPGHGPDFEAPAVVEMFPAYGAVVPDLDEDAFVRFDEPLGDPRSLERRIVTSPAWPYVINVGRGNTRIRPRDGWRAGVVYHFTIPPGVRDMIRNQTREPIDFLFTTGETLSATSTSGRVLDRVNVRTVRDVRVLVLGEDSIPYTAVTDTAGSFSLTSLPTGEYWAFAFRDQNQNLVLDRAFEAHDSGRVELPDHASSATMELWLVPPDSTPPVLASAEALDSVRIVLTFDELLEPDHPLGEASIGVRRRDTGEIWPLESFVVGEFETTLDSVPEAAAGEMAPEEEDDQAPGLEQDDEVSAGVVAEEVADSMASAEPAREERARPQGKVSARLARPLETATYEVSARGFANLRLLLGGGDTTFVYEPPPEPPPADADSNPGAEEAPDPDVEP